jgi:hypothetical protein
MVAFAGACCGKSRHLEDVRGESGRTEARSSANRHSVAEPAATRGCNRIAAAMSGGSVALGVLS